MTPQPCPFITCTYPGEHRHGTDVVYIPRPKEDG